jgi:4-hydroxyphenylacetate 3-monooxygenase oxygenase component
MTVRDGAAYIAGLKQHPREVWVAGRRVDDVTTDPVFRRPVAHMAQLYDLQTAPDWRQIMTYSCEDTGETAGASFLIPRSRADLVKRRGAMKVWADATFGTVGRSPDYMNTVLMSFAEGAEFFGRRGARFAENVRNYYKLCRDKDLFITHAIVDPSTDRSKPASEQTDPHICLSAIKETGDGLVVRGAKMLATHGPTADELLVYPLPGSLRPGEEKYALAFGIPCDTKGLRFISREPFDAGNQSEWDHPLGARFEEPDAVVVFDDVLIPWERVFLYGDVAMGNALFVEASIQNNTGHQTAVRGLAKTQFMAALAVAITRTVKTDGFLHVQEQLGEILGDLQMIEGAILLSEENAEPTGRGAIRPAWAPLQALRYHIPRMYERMVQVTQVLGAGGLLINPTAADLHSAIGGDIERYYRGATVDAHRRVQLYKLAWDATGTQFGQRMLQYERYYAGDPVRVGATMYNRSDVKPLLAMVERALGPSAGLRSRAESHE